MKSTKPLSRKANLVTQEANGEILIFDLNINKAYCLNETSSLIWTMCDGKKTVGEISRQLSEKLNASANEDLVWLAIDGLKAKNLLDDAGELAVPFAAESRREVIKKVGLATMVALPVISSLIAPKAAHAGSRTIANCSACNPAASFQCVSGRCTVNASNNNPPNICTAGTANGAFTSGTSFGANTAEECTSRAAQSCCSGSSSSYNSTTLDCTCR